MALVNGLVYEFKIDLNVDTCKIQTALDGKEMFKRKRASLSTHLMLLQCLFLQILSRFPFAYTLFMHITWIIHGTSMADPEHKGGRRLT